MGRKSKFYVILVFFSVTLQSCILQLDVAAQGAEAELGPKAMTCVGPTTGATQRSEPVARETTPAPMGNPRAEGGAARAEAISDAGKR